MLASELPYHAHFALFMVFEQNINFFFILILHDSNRDLKQSLYSSLYPYNHNQFNNHNHSNNHNSTNNITNYTTTLQQYQQQQ